LYESIILKQEACDGALALVGDSFGGSPRLKLASIYHGLDLESSSGGHSVKSRTTKQQSSIIQSVKTDLTEIILEQESFKTKTPNSKKRFDPSERS
jgi:hypothetical protein